MQVALLTRSAMWYNPAPCGQFDGAEDAALLVLARRHHLLPLPLDDPGRWEPGQQVDVRLVLGQDHRACGHGRDLFDGGRRVCPGSAACRHSNFHMRNHRTAVAAPIEFRIQDGWSGVPKRR